MLVNSIKRVNKHDSPKFLFSTWLSFPGKVYMEEVWTQHMYMSVSLFCGKGYIHAYCWLHPLLLQEFHSEICRFVLEHTIKVGFRQEWEYQSKSCTARNKVINRSKSATSLSLWMCKEHTIACKTAGRKQEKAFVIQSSEFQVRIYYEPVFRMAIVP